MPIPEVEDIFKKYNEDEYKIENLLNSKQDDSIPSTENSHNSNTSVSLEEVTARNKLYLKDLEIAKANLRSKAIFSPSEMQWDRIYQNYNKSPSMPVTTYKCHLPVFV